MKKLIYVPIESLEERYSAQWNQWFPEYFKNEDIPYLMIDPPSLSDRIRDGSFLDVTNTNYYKSLQTAELCELIYNGKINSGDTLFYADVWNPGISHLAYVRDGLKRDIKIVGCIFSGTYDPFDFTAKTGMGYWGKDLENSWFRILDKIFVATEFHKRLILEHRDCDPKKLIVTGHPIFPQKETIKFQDKENIVVFPHRLDSEKNPQLFDELAEEITATRYNWQFIKTKDICKTKQEYFNLLRIAKIAISFADQETFGFAMIEATFAGCFPVVPNRLSYQELYHECFKYGSFLEAKQLVLLYMDFASDYYQKEQDINSVELMSIGVKAIPNMMKEIL